MKNPLFQETDTIRQGATYIRRYNTGTLDTSGMTPRATMQKRIGGALVTDQVQMSRLSGGEYDQAFDWALVISRAITGGLIPNAQYFINIDFDAANGVDTIPHGVISVTVAPGEPHP